MFIYYFNTILIYLQTDDATDPQRYILAATHVWRELNVPLSPIHFSVFHCLFRFKETLKSIQNQNQGNTESETDIQCVFKHFESSRFRLGFQKRVAQDYIPFCFDKLRSKNWLFQMVNADWGWLLSDLRWRWRLLDHCWRYLDFN